MLGGLIFKDKGYIRKLRLIFSLIVMGNVRVGYQILGLIIITVRVATIWRGSDSKAVNFATVEPLHKISIDIILPLPTDTAPIVFPPIFYLSSSPQTQDFSHSSA
jgi:hypothetical protein